MIRFLAATLIVSQLGGDSSRLGHAGIEPFPRLGGSGFRGPSSSAGPFFDFDPQLPSLANISKTLTINGVAVQPSVWCQGNQATLSDWACDGATLTAAGSGGAVDVASPMGLATAVDPAGTRFWDGPDTSYGSAATKDFVLALIFYTDPTGTNSSVAGTFDGTSGWLVTYQPTLSRAFIALDNGPTFVQANVATSLPNGEWNLVVFVVDRSGSVRGYVNGATRGTATVSTVTDSIASTEPLRIGDRHDVLNASAHTPLGFMALWEFDDIGTHDQDQAMRDFAAQVFGVPVGYNSVTGRASAATYVRDDLHHQVGAGWVRVEADGYLRETGTTNQFIRSTDLSTGWTIVGSTVGGSVTTPDGATSTVAGLIPDATTSHLVAQGIAYTAVPYTISVYAKAGNQDWIALRALNALIPTAYFDLANGVVGTAINGATSRITPAGDGWYRCEMTFTATAATSSTQIYAAEADNDTSFVGDAATVAVYLWGMQAEALAKATSHVLTTTGTGTRTQDNLQYTIDPIDIDGRGISLVANFDRGVARTATGLGWLASLSEGASLANRVDLLFSGNLGRLFVVTDSVTQADTTGAPDITDGQPHTLSVFAKADDIRLFVDGTQAGIPDTSSTAPDQLDTVTPGSTASSTNLDLAQHISRVRIYRGEVRQ